MKRIFRKLPGSQVCLFLFLLSGLIQASPPAHGQSELIGDRLILELNRNSFSQRQAEVFLLIRSLMQDTKTAQKKTEPWLIFSDNWAESREQFRESMSIFLETKRLEQFQPQNTEIQAMVKRVWNQQDQHHEVRSAFERLDIDRWTIVKTVAMIMQIEEFRRLKEGSGEKSWLRNLEGKYDVRWFTNAEKWVRISAAGKAGKSEPKHKK